MHASSDSCAFHLSTVSWARYLERVGARSRWGCSLPWSPPTLLIPLLRCQITSVLLLTDLRASPRSFKSDSVNGYTRLYLLLWETHIYSLMHACRKAKKHTNPILFVHCQSQETVCLLCISLSYRKSSYLSFHSNSGRTKANSLLA